jgi:hypothetical protein
MTPPRINLLYVASIGRSGTTLFESMLGAHQALATCGELHLWPHELRMGGVRPCGSGLHVQDCPFWTEMRRRVDPLAQPAPALDHFREHHDGGRTLRLARLSDFRPGPLPPAVAEQVRTYGQNNYEIFSAFRELVEETTGRRPEWIVDASKDPYRLLWLLRSGLFNIKVVHMVKDPRGFAYSVTKNWVDASSLRDHASRYYFTARQSLAWVVQNQLLDRIRTHHLAPENYQLLRYEALASAPHEHFRATCKFIGVDYVASAVTDFRSGSQFTIAGNPMRYEDRPIQLDEKWKSRLPRSSQLIARTITGLNRHRFGY